MTRVKQNYFLRIQQDINLHKIILPPRARELRQITIYDIQKREVQFKIHKLTNLLNNDTMYLVPVLKELNTLLDSFEKISTIRQQTLLFWKEHGVEGDLMNDILEYMDKFCSEHSLQDVIENWLSFVNDVNHQIGVEVEFKF
ncbi:hypothetical protein TVAG_031690 [Trichomonas vaginalis G3]|uniref:Uncharacterized protein n=1 Tax=Trichomonas vaginalis (strain ATCC PRA-98 / G3) TaxID=412133 RepID=A2GHV9_TRIV3|nr:hypothetical protein TVAGG3_1057650 [Trichomonas vaginalis G3]EAX83258.1 hypothetical protein TVAG_031690 [Trichomonas vaginalis G3]KAI5494539.1 hypothetical protein TVAGG3_1057650 [Trichomonas vaginalis G3]|eukprot:XP_001296188.1 hypothetical protein [Trichomonas vaginalis G3]